VSAPAKAFEKQFADLRFEASLIEEIEEQAKYIGQVAAFLLTKNKGSFKYAVMPKEERTKSWTLSPSVASCISYYKVIFMTFTSWSEPNGTYANLNDPYSRRRGSFTSTLIPSRGITNLFQKSITRETGCFSQIGQDKVKRRLPIWCSWEEMEC
jgi:hypothetical protein